MSIEEADEWTAILKFNALLHYQEQKQAAERQRERTRLMKKQLNEQKAEKEVKRKEYKKEAQGYHQVLMAHLDLVDQRENEKQL